MPKASRGPNMQLIGKPAARTRLSTPALILDLDVLEANILRMAEAGREFGVGIRPHVKCHKSVAIAKKQIAAGAVGICCATIGEAEVMGHAGISNILITSPLITEDKIFRAVELSGIDEGLCVVTDHPLNAMRLSALFKQAGRRIGVVIDIDSGMRRTGVASQKNAIELARLVQDLDNLDYRGVQCYAGHVQHIENTEKRQEAALSVMGGLKVLCEELSAIGLMPAIVTGGGTGTFDIDGPAGVLTELQVGSYVFMDAQYNRVWMNGGLTPPFDVSLFVQSSVISSNFSGGVTCDAGLKHFAVDGGVPIIARGAPGGVRYEYRGDEHGHVTFAEGASKPDLGDRMEFIVPHCDPTVNLYNYYHCVRGDELVDIWPIDARGL